MIATLEEIKEILRISETTNEYDNLIQRLRPIVQDWVCKWCNNYFEVGTDTLYLETNTISFENSTPALIKDSDNGLIDAGFKDGMHLRIQGSLYNDGIYEVQTVEAGKLTLLTGEKLIDEDLGYSVLITVVRFDPGLKLPYAALIGEDLKNELDGEEIVTAERVGNTSFNYGGAKYKGEYPEPLLAKLRPYKRIVKV